MPKWLIVVGGLFVVGIIGNAITNGPGGSSTPATPKTAAADPKPADPKDIQRGILVFAAKKLKESAHDPASFQLDSLLMTKAGAGCYEFRAKNAFNALRKGRFVMAEKVALANGDKGFVAAWNRHCAGKDAEDLTAYARTRL